MMTYDPRYCENRQKGSLQDRNHIIVIFAFCRVSLEPL
jgi:hypothetical protein